MRTPPNYRVNGCVAGRRRNRTDEQDLQTANQGQEWRPGPLSGLPDILGFPPAS